MKEKTQNKTEQNKTKKQKSTPPLKKIIFFFFSSNICLKSCVLQNNATFHVEKID